MRGTQDQLLACPDRTGLIPTYAGNTRCPALSARRLGAHPHVCGEHLRLGIQKTGGAGSSPRMRGTHQHTHGQLGSTGLIPTYAGNTFQTSTTCIVDRAHPHVCGEHPGLCTPQTKRAGSSPRMRGTPRPQGWQCWPAGLIPTYAGNTLGGLGVRRGRGAHPHVCGEHPGAIEPEKPSMGSSPRMRGTRVTLPAPGRLLGLIPTYAGNTEALAL